MQKKSRSEGKTMADVHTTTSEAIKGASKGNLLANTTVSIPGTDSLDLLDHDELVKMVKGMIDGGIGLSFYGKRSAMEISKRVRPRITRRVADLHIGTPEQQSKNLLIEGENLQAMVTLYKYLNQVDLIVTDPPYNTGEDFRYNDKWDKDPNDPDLGPLVPGDDGSRHSKWLRFMTPRILMMREMLKPGGVIAICIDHRELFRLGMLMDEIFQEENRIGIINWQKAYSPKNDTGGKRGGLSSATEYVLVYAKNMEQSKTGLLDRTDAMNARYTNPDNDPEGEWASSDATAPEYRSTGTYAIQSPFTGKLHYPARGHWRVETPEIKKGLEAWGSSYVALKLDDKCEANALVLKGCKFNGSKVIAGQSVLSEARKRAQAILKRDNWPQLIFTDDGDGGPRFKTHLNKIRRGKVPLTYWADEEYSVPFQIGTQSWDHKESGHSQAGINELDSIAGHGHNFKTVKPLRLITKIIQLWCPAKGLVMDPFAGSGTTGHSVLEINYTAKTDRRFILIEQGRPENGDKYARTLTHTRLKRVIAGMRTTKNGHVAKTADPLGGGFEFRSLTNQIDAKAVLSMRRDELVDVVITSHWETGRRNTPNLIRIDEPSYKYLVGRNDQGAGYFIIWSGNGPVGQLDIETYRVVLEEGKRAGLKPPYHVYARYEVYQSKNVYFYKIPDKILTHLGFNENSDSYNESHEGDN